MAINPLQIPSYAAPQTLDFTPLANLGNVYKRAQNEQKLSDLGRGLADGTVDYKQAGAQTAGMGDITHTLQFLALAEAQKKQAAGVEATNQFTQGLQGTFGAQPSAAPPTPNPMPVPGAAPRNLGPMASADPSVRMASTDPGAPLAGGERVPSSDKVWGTDEAEAAGLYEPKKPTTLAQLQPRAPAAQETPQLGAKHVPQLLGAIANPNLPAGPKEAAKMMLKQAFDNMKEPERVQLLKALKDRPDLLAIETELAKARGTTVTVGGEKKFNEKLDEGQAKRWNGYIETGQAARRKLVDIDTMRDIHQRIGSQGAAAGIKEAIGPYAEVLGINIDGLSDIQAYSQVIQRLAPQQRAEGSGSTSDIEFKGFLKSLPTLTQNPAAREIGLNTMEALARDEVARGEIAQSLAIGEIDRKQAEIKLRALPDPMKGFADWRKANPGIYGQALKGQSVPAAAKPMKFTPQEADESLANAREAIVKNPAAKAAIIKKLRDNGLPTDGL